MQTRPWTSPGGRLPEGKALNQRLASTPSCIAMVWTSGFLESLKLSFWAFPWEWSLFFGNHNLNRGRRLGDLAFIRVPLGLRELWCSLVKRVNLVLCLVKWGKYEVSLYLLEQRTQRPFRKEAEPLTLRSFEICVVNKMKTLFIFLEAH